nr:hypothetical protein [Tanacetum cinerariifolium]
MESLQVSIQERAKYKQEYDKRMNDRMMLSKEGKVDLSKSLNVGLVITESSRTKSDKQDTSSTSGNDTDALVADTRLKSKKEPRDEVQLTAEHNVLANEQQHYVQSKPVYDTYLNSQEESYGSNDMAHNHYLKNARKKTQERNRNSKSSVKHTTSLQNITNGSKQKPRSNNQTSRSLTVSNSSCGMSNGVQLVDHSTKSSSFLDSNHFVCSTCQKCVFNANHDACLTKFLKEVNSRIKVPSPKTRNNIKSVEKKNNVIKPKRLISKGYRISPNKSFAVHEKPNIPRSCLRWKPTGRIFKTVGHRWIPTRKIFTDSTTVVENEPLNGSNEDITNPYECEQTLNVSAGTLNLSACTSFNPKEERLRV